MTDPRKCIFVVDINDRVRRYLIRYDFGPNAYWFIDRENRPGLTRDWRYTIYQPGIIASTWGGSPCAGEMGHARTLNDAVELTLRLMRQQGLYP